MSVVEFSAVACSQENITFLEDCVVNPHIFEEDAVEIFVEEDLTVRISHLGGDKDFLLIPPEILERDVYKLIGLCTFMRKYLVEEKYVQSLRAILTHFFNTNLPGLIFYYGKKFQDENYLEIVAVKGSFNRKQEIVETSLEVYMTLSHFFESFDSRDLRLLNLAAEPNTQKVQVDLIRTTEQYYAPIACNEIDIVGNSVKQIGGAFLKNYNLLLLLPRVYSLGGMKDPNTIMTHVESLMHCVSLTDEYSKEIAEMDETNSSTAGLKFFHEELPNLLHGNSILGSILTLIADKQDTYSARKQRAIYQGLGFIVAQKHRCCKECRHLDLTNV